MKLFSLVSIGMCLCFYSCKSQDLGFNQFVPKGYKTIDKIYGDLNADGERDCVLIIKGTNPEQVVTNRFDQIVDRNRRGIIVLLNKEGQYYRVVNNKDCFYSENEDGGVYYAPQLSISITKGDLLVKFEHGRYGFWQYNFRYQNAALELIHYEATRGGAITESITSIDFLIKERIDKVNVSESAGANESFEESKKQINVTQLLKLSTIKAFEDLIMEY